MDSPTTDAVERGSARLAEIREDISARLYAITEAMPRVTFDALVDQMALVQHRGEKRGFPPPRVVDERLGPVERRATPSQATTVVLPRSEPGITAKVFFDPVGKRLVGSVSVGHGSYWSAIVTMFSDTHALARLALTRHHVTASKDEGWEVTVPIAELQAMAALFSALAADPATRLPDVPQ